MNQQAQLSQSTSIRARVGELALDSFPDDLFIPPQAFAVWLEQFEGPLDFLLYLVRKNGLDLRELNIAPIAQQYLNYIDTMQKLDVALAGDYLVMAALLIDIKSRLLLPRTSPLQIEEDPRQNLLERLEKYAALKEQAQALNKLPLLGRDQFTGQVYKQSFVKSSKMIEKYDYYLLHQAMQRLLNSPKLMAHFIQADSVNLNDKIKYIKQTLENGPQPFLSLLNPSQGKVGIVVSFIAILELLRQQLITFYHANMAKDSMLLDINFDNEQNNLCNPCIYFTLVDSNR